ncbi:hypothetical protein DH2020_005678 [Rehmannia glutinosa]|uniref:Uncharacterized protein n=1 Tax=Rehmannia glutinosa TaxID=99300 RepID=A0ABR0XGY3_REHGL
MAKPCATIIALFCLFTLSIAAHTPPENDEATTKASLPLTHPNPNLHLSSVDLSVPLTTTFRTVNRRFPVRSKHPCRHHLKIHPTMMEKEEIPYGNDMIVSSGENSDFEEPVLHDGGRRIRRRWGRLHHYHHHHDGEDSDSDDEDRIKKIVFKRFDRENEFRVLKKLKHFRIQNAEGEKKKNSGVMKRVGKFLDHYF